MLSCLQRELIKLRMLVTNLQESVARSATANHEEVRYPVGGVYVVGTTALVSRVLSKFEEVLYVEVPRL